MKYKLLSCLAVVLAASAAFAQNRLAVSVRQNFRNGDVIRARQLLGINQQYDRLALQNVVLTGQAMRPGVVLSLMINGQVVGQSQASTMYGPVRFRVGGMALNGTTLQVRVQGGEYYLDTLEANFAGQQPGPNPHPNPGPFPPGPNPYPNPGPFPPGPPHPQSVMVTCSSFQPLSGQCAAGGYIQTVQLVSQMSNSPCIYRQTWWYDASNIYVTNGCRATFQVYLRY